MATPASLILASILSEPIVVVALISAAAALGARAFPKTRTEAGVDRASARLSDAGSWEKLVQGHERAIERLQEDISKLRERAEAAETIAERSRERAVAAETAADEARNALEEERREHLRQVDELRQRVAEIESRQPPERLFFRE